MKNKTKIWIVASLIVVVLIGVIIYVKIKPTKFTINCEDYDVTYYKCEVSSPLPFGSDFGFNAVTMCLKDKPSSLQGIDDCANLVWSKTNCKNINNNLVQVSEEYIIQGTGYCKKLNGGSFFSSQP